MIEYEIRKNELSEVIVRKNLDGSISYIPLDPANSDYEEYLNPSETKIK
jgi:hypothetical protein